MTQRTILSDHTVDDRLRSIVSDVKNDIFSSGVSRWRFVAGDIAMSIEYPSEESNTPRQWWIEAGQASLSIRNEKDLVSLKALIDFAVGEMEENKMEEEDG